ncbi:uncharacterized protein N0V89_007534 [Didymosphaeria variabile]|uniref:Uncharacterized protein n=1 Tax=Didymosphaeria variabile TaxID=1932322 RepID=A0A9W8XJS8_9PLEO|nr:uncharacterized protein N0V89_007534 [Didymosphaeria variabile]KAJ4352187.1 hypothetical protein N0V89_007534 [Didymosphaeria variabile]
MAPKLLKKDSKAGKSASIGSSKIVKRNSARATNKTNTNPAKYFDIVDEHQKRKAERARAVVVTTVSDAGYSIGLPTGSTEPFPAFIDLYQIRNNQGDEHYLISKLPYYHGR